jgi:hypothetical protein
MVLAAPAKVGLADAKAAADKDEKEGILAQAAWPFPKTPKEPMTVLRGAKDVMTAFGASLPPGADEAKMDAQVQTEFGKKLKFAAFDFKKHMLIVMTLPSGTKGSIEFTGAKVKDKKLRVAMKMVPGEAAPAGGAAWIAVVERFEGEVLPQPEKKEDKEKKD